MKHSMTKSVLVAEVDSASLDPLAMRSESCVIVC